MYGEERGLIDHEYLADAADGISGHVDDCVGRAQSGQRAWRTLDNLVNFQWYTGNPYCMRRPAAGSVMWLPVSQRTKYVNINKSFDAVRTLKGVMWYNPDCESAPKTPDPEDATRANFATVLGKNIIQNGDLAGAYDRALDLCHITGGAFLKPVWDPTEGSMRPVFGQVPCPQCDGQGVVPGPSGVLGCSLCATQGVMLDATGQPVTQEDGEEPEGNVIFQVVSINDMFPDPGAKRMDQCHWLTQRDVMHVSRAWHRWGRYLGITEAELKAASQDVFADTQVLPGMNMAAATSLENYVTILEHWERPSEKFPRGLLVVKCGDLILAAGPLPNISTINWCPFFFLPMYEVEGLLYPMGTLDLMLPLMIQYNDHLTIGATRARLSAQLRFQMTRSQAASLDDESGNMVYNHVQNHPAPQPLSLASFPQESTGIVQVLDAAMQDISAASDAARGKYDTATTDNATAMAFIEERSIGPLKPIMAKQQKKLEGVVQYGVDLARNNFQDGRMVRIAGEGGAPEFHAFQAENVGDATDVRLVIVRNQGQSRAAMLGQVNEAFKSGYLDAPTALKLSEFGDMGALYQEKQLHRNKAVNEYKTLREQQMIPYPVEFEDHAIHMETHRLQLAAAGINNPPDSPIVLGLIEHIRVHRDLAANEAFQMAQAQQVGAAAFGMANAADPGMQPQSAIDGAEAAGAPADVVNPAPPGGPGTQQSLDSADQTAQSFAKSAQQGAAQ